MHKIQITSIENIPWAQRLIINFYLIRDCFNPAVGGWEYILSDCGYKGLCDSEWINITPNTQHPLHSTIIRYAGNYTFVWDYGGVHGIDPANFNSSHSYIIQLVLADRTCGFIDPCADASYVTVNGEEPTGIVGTNGDVGNTYNNCGDGYVLRADNNGCLFCEAIPYNSGSGVTEPSASTSDSGWDISQPSQPTGPSTPSNPSQPSEPSDPSQPSGYDSGASGSSGDPSSPSQPSGSGDPSSSSIVEPSQAEPSMIDPDEPMGFAGDLPPLSPLTPGPMGPGGRPTPDVVGGPAESPLPLVYDYELGGDIPFVSGSFGPEENIGGALSRTTYGGMSSKVDPSRTLNARVPAVAKALVSKLNAALNQRRRATFLNLNTNQIKSQSKRSDTSDIKNRTKPQATIVIVGDVAYIRQKETTPNGVTPNTQPLNDRTKIPRQYTSASDGRVTKTNSKQVQFTSDTLKTSISPGSRVLSSILEKVKANVFNLSMASDFDSNFEFGVKTELESRSGDSHYYEAFIRPRARNAYRLVLSVFLKSGENVYHIATSSDITRSGIIRIAQQIPMKVPSGMAHIISVVYDNSGTVMAVKANDIRVLDIFSSRGGVLNLPNTTAARFDSSIDGLISSNSSLLVPIGAPGNSVDLLASVNPGTSTEMILAAMVKSVTPNVEHGIKLTNDTLSIPFGTQRLLANTVGRLNLNGLNPTGNYSAAAYVPTIRGSTDTIRVTVSSTANRSSVVNVHCGRDITLIPFEVTSSSYSGGYHTATMATPFYNTELIAYASGVANYAPTLIRSTVNFTTSAAGIGTFTLAGSRYTWITVALKYPTDIPLDKRVVYTFKGAG